jgi:enolase
MQIKDKKEHMQALLSLSSLPTELSVLAHMAVAVVTAQTATALT